MEVRVTKRSKLKKTSVKSYETMGLKNCGERLTTAL